MATIETHENYAVIQNEDDVRFLWKLDAELSYKVQGAEHTMAFKGYSTRDGKFVQWDGMNRLLNEKLQFPLGLVSRVKNFYRTHNKQIDVVDVRKPKTPSKPIDVISRLKEIGKTPYHYQVDAAAAAKENDRGIIRLATGGGKCNQGTDICLHQDGMLMMQELGKDLDVGEYRTLISEVASPLTTSGLEKTSHIYRDGCGDSIEYTTRHGFVSAATANHQIKVIDKNGEMVWKKIVDLQIDDVVVICHGQQLFGKDTSLSLDDAYFMGLITGDGTWTENSSSLNTVRLTNEDEHIISFFQKYAADKHLNVRINNHSKSLTCKECHITNKKFATWLKSVLPPNHAHNKTIPLSIRKSEKQIVAMFLRGLYETDGWIESKPSINIAFSSKQLIDQLQVILLNFGIVATRRVKKTTHKDSHVLIIYREFIPKFCKEIGLNPAGHKYKKLQQALESFKYIKTNTNLNTIPNQSENIRAIKNSLKDILGLKKLKAILTDRGIEWSTLRSWSDNKAWREPSRDKLNIFIECACEYIKCKQLEILKTACNSHFFFDRIKTLKNTQSDNYDFVVPETHSFVAQGFINHNTVVSALVTAQFGKRTILYVIGCDLLYQTHKFFSLVFPDHKIGLIGDGNCDIQEINIASVWTVGQALGMKKTEILAESDDEKKVDPQKYEDIRNLLRTTKVHMFDECHLAACTTIQEICKAINPEHVYGMSASPWRDDGADLLIESVLGRNIVDISASYLIDNGFLVKPLIKFMKVPPLAEKLPKQFQTIYKNYIVENPVRNAMVVKGAINLVEQGYQTLVLYNSVAHGSFLASEIAKTIPCILLSGKDSSEVREEAKKKLERGEVNCVVASKIFDIGVDLPSLSGLIIASGGKSSVRALQRIGRVIRKYEGKTKAAVIDFYDQAHFLKDHSKERFKIYSMEERFDVVWPK